MQDFSHHQQYLCLVVVRVMSYNGEGHMPRLANSMAASFESSCHGLSNGRRISSYHTMKALSTRTLSEFAACQCGWHKETSEYCICTRGLAIPQSNDVPIEHPKRSYSFVSESTFLTLFDVVKGYKYMIIDNRHRL